MQHPIVSREDWLMARKALFEKERAMTHQLDALRAERRQLPWVRVEKPYVFDGPDGGVTLGDLFGGRSQLAVYHFMLTPGSDHICPGCSFTMDHADAARRHFEQADLAFAAVSRAPVRRIEAVRKRMGWTFPWVSSDDRDFNYDFGVSFTPEDRAAGRALYNYGLTTIRNAPDMFGLSIFAKDEEGGIYHTYSTYHRGTELLIGALNWLDLVPKGRNESGTMSWVKLHDEY
ncbi:DUF899 domain-containing protein [Shinella sp.]|uniref:DUF899 domain-containing protein n=1 Tax=Shinella sp. TaxID=1870904 RepID=UPI0039E32A86